MDSKSHNHLDTTEEGWQEHAKTLEGVSPRPLLVKAVPFVGHRREALDLGSGPFNDTKYLLEQDFVHVTAVDSADLSDFGCALPTERFTFVRSTFDTFDFPEHSYDLVNAQVSLPFNPPETFVTMFEKMKRSLVLGGIFTGSFFGRKDSWVGTPEMTFHTEEEVRNLFSDMEVVSFVEREWDGITTDGEKKHWDVYFVIAKKI